MTPLRHGLWGAALTGQLALGASCALRWFQLPYAPWYQYIETADLVPTATMLALALLARSKFKIAALIVWTLLALFALCAAVATFPHWDNGITDVPRNVESRFETISVASEALMYFAALVLSVTGLALLKLELANRRPPVMTAA
jgi:hypothetical protein